jgi:hypothetical protein
VALVEPAEDAGIWTIETGVFPENGASLAVHGTRRHPGAGFVRRRETAGTRSPLIHE